MKLEWAQDYIKRFENQPTIEGGTIVGSVEYEFYKLAKAIVADESLEEIE